MFQCPYLTQTATFVLGSQDVTSIASGIANFDPVLEAHVVEPEGQPPTQWERVDCRQVQLEAENPEDKLGALGSGSGWSCIGGC
jgi:hypothetical protein